MKSARIPLLLSGILLLSLNTPEYVRTGGPQMGYQHLVVDRGSIGPFDIIFC